MAIDISDRYVAEHTRGPGQDRLRTIIKLAPVIRTYRRVLRLLTRGIRYQGAAECRITEGLEHCASHFQQHRWALVENFFSDEFHRELVSQWPSRYEFNPPTTLVKSYDTGFAWSTHDESGPPRRLRKYSALVELWRYLRSAEYSRRLGRVYGKGVNFHCNAFLMHMTREGSQVVPHRDSYYNSRQPALNILMFVNGRGGKNGGGLAISRDNELKDVIVEARNLRNSALLYDVKSDFYHGFRAVAEGEFRWSMASEFKIHAVRDSPAPP